MRGARVFDEVVAGRSHGRSPTIERRFDAKTSEGLGRSRRGGAAGEGSGSGASGTSGAGFAGAARTGGFLTAASRFALHRSICFQTAAFACAQCGSTFWTRPNWPASQKRKRTNATFQKSPRHLPRWARSSDSRAARRSLWHRGGRQGPAKSQALPRSLDRNPPPPSREAALCGNDLLVRREHDGLEPLKLDRLGQEMRRDHEIISLGEELGLQFLRGLPRDHDHGERAVLPGHGARSASRSVHDGHPVIERDDLDRRLGADEVERPPGRCWAVKTFSNPTYSRRKVFQTELEGGIHVDDENGAAMSGKGGASRGCPRGAGGSSSFGQVKGDASLLKHRRPDVQCRMDLIAPGVAGWIAGTRAPRQPSLSRPGETTAALFQPVISFTSFSRRRVYSTQTRRASPCRRHPVPHGSPP